MQDHEVDFGRWADFHQDTIEIEKDITFLLWIKEESGWLFVNQGLAIKFFNHIHDFVNNTTLADPEHNSDKWNKVIDVYKSKYSKESIFF